MSFENRRFDRQEAAVSPWWPKRHANVLVCLTCFWLFNNRSGVVVDRTNPLLDQCKGNHLSRSGTLSEAVSVNSNAATPAFIG